MIFVQVTQVSIDSAEQKSPYAGQAAMEICDQRQAAGKECMLDLLGIFSVYAQRFDYVFNFGRHLTIGSENV